MAVICIHATGIGIRCEGFDQVFGDCSSQGNFTTCALDSLNMNADEYIHRKKKKPEDPILILVLLDRARCVSGVLEGLNLYVP